MIKWYRKRKLNKLLREIISSAKHILRADDDVLTDTQKLALMEIQVQGEQLRENGTVDAIKQFCESARQRISRNAPSYRSCRIREVLDILAVAFTVAFGIRGLYAQPFKIPTSSMQPTLFGIHYMEKDVVQAPYPASFLLYSAVPAAAEIKADGRFDVSTFIPGALYGNTDIFGKLFFGYSSFKIGNAGYTLPGSEAKVADYTHLSQFRDYRKGDILSDGWLSMGDHLFVDRISHHFSDFKRGEIVIFNTEDITERGKPLAGYFYIKRLAGMPGDTLRIDGNQLMVKPRGAAEFKPVQDIAPAFKKVYSRMGGYHGHLNIVGGGRGYYLGSPSEEFVVPDDSYFMLGDNSLFSSDSRMWGVVPRRNMVGRAALVFWPFSRRWGIPDHAGPVQVPTTSSEGNTFPQMSLQ